MEVIDRQLVFDENQTSQAVNIGIVMDDMDENNEDFYLIIEDATQENSTNIVKRATIMLDVGGVAKVTIGKSFLFFITIISHLLLFFCTIYSIIWK